MAKLCNDDYVLSVSNELGISLSSPWSTRLKLNKYIGHLKLDKPCLRTPLPPGLSSQVDFAGIETTCDNGPLAVVKMDKPVWQDTCMQAGGLDGVEAILLDMSAEHADTTDTSFNRFECEASKNGLHRAVAKCAGNRVLCIFLKRPVITMKTLGTNGRWANQLIQYLWLRIMGERHGVVVQCPTWHGSIIFGIATTPPAEGISWEADNFDHIPNVKSLTSSDKVRITQNTDFWGYWQNGFDAYANPWREFASKMFTPSKPISIEMEMIWSKVKSRASNIVGSHLRRGDYSQAGPGWGFHPTPFRWHDRWIVDNVSTPCAVYIASEDASAIAAKPWSVRTTHVGENSHLPKSADWLVDFEMLKRCKTICMSNSTYSYMAGWLASPSKVVRPSLSSWSMVEETFEGKASMLDWTAPNAEQWDRLIVEDR